MTADWCLSSFANPTWHAAIAGIIRSKSTNAADVRAVALDGLDLSFATSVLDLGCGFGFMTEAVAPRVAPGARIIGLDACATNEESYLQRVAATGRTARFVRRRVEHQLDWPDHSFDLIVASYSLYFFPEIIPEVARILSPNGLFVALTHMEAACRDLLRVSGVRETDAPLLPVSHNFCAENGHRRLAPWFGDIDRVDYENSLVFEADEHDDLFTYLRFKLPFLSPDSEPRGELPEPLWKSVQQHLSHQGRVVLAKSDAAFRCRHPRSS